MCAISRSRARRRSIAWPRADRTALQNGVAFSRLRAEFSRQNGQWTIREGVVKGPMIGGTIEGIIDYPGNQVRMSGTFVPMYGLNNMFGQLPVLGLFLGGGSNEGLIGVTYELVGTPASRSCASIRSRRWRRACSERSSNSTPASKTTRSNSPGRTIDGMRLAPRRETVTRHRSVIASQRVGRMPAR